MSVSLSSLGYVFYQNKQDDQRTLIRFVDKKLFDIWRLLLKIVFWWEISIFVSLVLLSWRRFSLQDREPDMQRGILTTRKKDSDIVVDNKTWRKSLAGNQWWISFWLKRSKEAFLIRESEAETFVFGETSSEEREGSASWQCHVHVRMTMSCQRESLSACITFPSSVTQGCFFCLVCESQWKHYIRRGLDIHWLHFQVKQSQTEKLS